METKSGIGWTDYSINFWIGCRKVSEACKNCYMFREMKRYGRDPNVVTRTKPNTWRKPYRVKEPSKFFVCSWSDFYIEEADEWRTEAWQVMRDNPQHIFQILTKRPERIKSQMPLSGLPENAWIGISAENQRRFDERIEYLYGFEASVKYISVEPMLGSLTLGKHTEVIDWTIAGGESGTKARPSNTDWFRQLQEECKNAGIPYFFKQFGEYVDMDTAISMGYNPYRPTRKHLIIKGVTLPFVRLGKKKAGNLLDGKKWEQFPKYARREAV